MKNSANEGFFTILAGKRCGNNGTVIAFEPQEKLWQIILKNVLLNGLDNIKLYPYGIGSSESNLDLQLYSSINSGATSFAVGYNFNISFKKLRMWYYGKQKSRIITLDQIRHLFPSKIDLIKLDIEGFEYHALLGAKSLLKEKRVINLLIETHDYALREMGLSEADIDLLLLPLGYQKLSLQANLFHYKLK